MKISGAVLIVHFAPTMVAGLIQLTRALKTPWVLLYIPLQRENRIGKSDW